METFGASISEVRNVAAGISNGGTVEIEGFKQRVDEIISKVDKLEQKVHDVENFYLSMNKKQTNMPKGNSATKDKDKEKHVPSIKKQQQDASRREAAASKRMQDLMRQFGTILRQITQHKWAWPFMQPVDVEGLGLHDYYESQRRGAGGSGTGWRWGSCSWLQWRELRFVDEVRSREGDGEKEI